MKSKILALLVIAAAVASFFYFGLNQYLTFEFLKTKQADFQAYYEQNVRLTIAIYFALYVAVTALSLPGAAIMTLAGGAIFGVVTGTIIVSFASSIGATLAFLAARFFLRDWVQKKLGDKISAINSGIEKDGAFYLFTLRLIPAFPFFAINLLMGLTPIKTATFYIISQIGMLAGTVVYVNAGTELSKISSLADLANPRLALSFALLGIFPLIAKKIVSTIQSRKILRKFKKPKKFDYNVVAIGAGAAGLVTSYIAAAVKAKVALIEKHKMGGDCLNFGCVPSKAIIKSAKVVNYMKRAEEFGLKKVDYEFDFAEVMERVQRVVAKIEPHDSVERYTQLGVDCMQGEAVIKSPYEVELNGKTITTQNIVIATGAAPFVPNIPGLEEVGYHTSDTIWGIRKLPRRLLVLGGGPIGSELTQAFARLGAEVTQVERSARIMAREDEDVSDFVMKKLSSDGVRILTEHSAEEFRIEGGQKIAICEHKGEKVKVEFDEVLIAVGRAARSNSPGIQELGIRLTDKKTIEVNEFLQTNYPNIYACGDIVGPYQFTHTAAHQAWFASVNALFGRFKKFKVDYRVIPWCTYTDPEVARVGLNELEAKEKGVDYEKTIFELEELDRAICEEEDHGFVKVLTVPGKDKILGVTIVGHHAGDYIAEYVAAMKHGFGLNKILGTIHIYPTLAEANKYAAGEWKRAHAPQGALQWLKKYHTWMRG